MCLLNLPTMLSYRVPANNMAQFPLAFFPYSHSPQKQTFCDFCMAKATNPVRSKTEKQGALRKAEEGGRRLLSGALMFHLLFPSLPPIISLESLEKRQHQNGFGGCPRRR